MADARFKKGHIVSEETKRRIVETRRKRGSYKNTKQYLVCQICKTGFYAKPSEARKGRKYCNRSCMFKDVKWREKQSESHKGQPSWIKGKHHSLETIRKFVETRRKNDSFKHSEASKQKLRKTLSNPEVKKRMSEAQKKVWTPELRKRRSEALKGKYVGKNSPSYGRKQSEENKKAHSEYMKKYFQTHKHPMLGKKRQVWNKDKKGLQIAWNKGKKMPELSEWGRKNILKQYESGDFPRQTNTKPERLIKEELLKREYVEGEDFIHQYKFMNKFMCDFCFPQQKVIVEVYGDFWHANPQKYPDRDKLYLHQIKDVGKDKSKEAYIRTVDNHSWTYFIIWESDIKRDVIKCADKIEEVLKGKIKTGEILEK